jgi:LCP family protein required for cell wall assembly
MADKLDAKQFQVKENNLTEPGNTSRRERIMYLLLGAFYTLVVISIAFFVGSTLYEVTYRYAFAQNALPNLDTLNMPVLAGADEASGESLTTTSTDIEGQRQALEALADNDQPRRISVLLLGTDERANEYDPPRTDTMMVVTLDLSNKTAGMISLPRDLWVPIPGYDITTKINTAYIIGERREYPGGGSQLSKDTVSSFIGRPVEYYVRINFSGFVSFIDLIGGIDINVPHTIHDELYPTPDYGVELFHLDAGLQHLDGETTLKYVRTRHGDSDYVRAERQQQVIQAVLDKILAADMIPTLVAKAPQLMATMRDSFGTDIPLPVAIDMANYIRQNNLENIERLVLDNRYGEESYSEDGAWILLPNRTEIRKALGEFFDVTDDGLTETRSEASIASAITASAADPSPQNAALVNDHAQIRLEILNGTDYPGVAARIRDKLTANGWQVVAIGDADRNDYRRTLVVNYNADESLVEQINSDLQLPPDLPTLNGLIISDTVDMRIIIGQDFVKNVLEISSP